MPLSTYLHETSVLQMSKMLRNLDGWLQKATEYAQAKSFDPDVLVQARLAPDQYPLARQVQAACDAAKFAAARLTGAQAPSHPDTETTMAELRGRIRVVLEYLEPQSPEAFEGAIDREVRLGYLPDLAIRGGHYLIDVAQPNFYFHVITAYSILRHNGVDLGKRDFIGAARFYPVQG